MQLLMRLQAIQDMLSDRIGLCLVIVNHRCKEITIPSGLPVQCLHSGRYHERCASEISHIIAAAKESEQPVFYRCFKDLYCFGLQTGFSAGGKGSFLIGGRTDNVTKIRENIDFLSAIYTLPLAEDLELTGPSVHSESRVLFVDPGLQNLSQQELKTLYLIGTGHSNKDIAAKLYISISTAKSHVSNVLRKIGAANRTEAALFAVQKGLVRGIGTFTGF